MASTQAFWCDNVTEWLEGLGIARLDESNVCTAIGVIFNANDILEASLVAVVVNCADAPFVTTSDKADCNPSTVTAASLLSLGKCETAKGATMVQVVVYRSLEVAQRGRDGLVSPE